jgi:hypothetical protein
MPDLAPYAGAIQAVAYTVLVAIIGLVIWAYDKKTKKAIITDMLTDSKKVQDEVSDILTDPLSSDEAFLDSIARDAGMSDDSNK